MKKLFISLISTGLGLSAFGAGNTVNSAPIPASSVGGQTQSAIGVTPASYLAPPPTGNVPAGSSCGSGRKWGYFPYSRVAVTPCNGQPIYIQGMGQIYHPATQVIDPNATSIDANTGNTVTQAQGYPANGWTSCSGGCVPAPKWVMMTVPAYYTTGMTTLDNCPAGYAVGDFFMDNDQSNAAVITSCLKQ